MFQIPNARAGRAVLGLIFALGVSAGAPVVAEGDRTGAATPGSDGAPGDPTIDLDQLLRLPDSYTTEGERRGGATASEWRARFREARESLTESRAELDRLQRELETKAVDSSSWAAGAPGLGNPDPQNQTLSYKLRADIRDARDAIDLAETELRELRVEADLADVPAAWRD